MFVHLSVCLYICLCVCTSVCVSVHLSVCLYICLCVCTSVCVSVRLSVSVCLSVCLYVCLYVSLSVCLCTYLRFPSKSVTIVMLPVKQMLLTWCRPQGSVLVTPLTCSDKVCVSSNDMRSRSSQGTVCGI